MNVSSNQPRPLSSMIWPSRRLGGNDLDHDTLPTSRNALRPWASEIAPLHSITSSARASTDASLEDDRPRR
ncbi:MAG: hypothetical protein ACJ8FP_08775, partial [Xanthobacteraceae bacterium]